MTNLTHQPPAPAPAPTTDTPLDLHTLLSPEGAYEPGTGREEGAQLLDQLEWWAPVHGCDTLETLLDSIRARILPHLRPPISGIDVPGGDGDYGDVLDLCAAEGVDPRVGVPLLKRARKAWFPAAPADGPAVPEGREPAADLPPDYIDEWIADPRDRALLEVFRNACNSEGGSADEVILRGLKAVLRDDRSRSYRLQQENRRFREPERTILCDILANGTLLPDPDGTRYGIPPAPAAGDVEELAKWLYRLADERTCNRRRGIRPHPSALTRVGVLMEQFATLLRQLSAAQALQPVAVSERPHGREVQHG